MLGDPEEVETVVLQNITRRRHELQQQAHSTADCCLHVSYGPYVTWKKGILLDRQIINLYVAACKVAGLCHAGAFPIHGVTHLSEAGGSRNMAKTSRSCFGDVNMGRALHVALDQHLKLLF